MKNKLDELLKDALDTMRKMDEDFKFIKENEENLTEDNEDQLDEVIYKLKKELFPEIEKLENNMKKISKKNKS